MPRLGAQLLGASRMRREAHELVRLPLSTGEQTFCARNARRADLEFEQSLCAGCSLARKEWSSRKARVVFAGAAAHNGKLVGMRNAH